MRDLLKKLTYYFVQRIYTERHKNLTWERPTPAAYKLTDADIERFVNILKPCLEHAMFSRQPSSDVFHAMQYLSALRPDIVVPIALDKLYLSMDSLTEPHKLIMSMWGVISVARYVVYRCRVTFIAISHHNNCLFITSHCLY